MPVMSHTSGAKHSAQTRRVRSKKEKRVGSKRQVLSGRKMETKGRLKKQDLVVNARGKVVSKKKHEAGKILYKNNEVLQKNAMAVQEARKTFGDESPSFKDIQRRAAVIKKGM